METDQAEVSFLSAPPDWKYSVRMFLKKHPAPREDHVAGLDRNAPREIDITTKTRGRKLANRYEMRERERERERETNEHLKHILIVLDCVSLFQSCKTPIWMSVVSRQSMPGNTRIH